VRKSVHNQNSLIALSALAILAGAMLSGPVSTGMVMLVRPQPAWVNTNVFIHHYHWIQTIPFMLGFVLLFSSCLFVAVASGKASEGIPKIMSNLALIMTSVYAALISLNYIIQIAYIPMLVTSNQQIAGLLTMTNPSSVCWAIEMFGYLFQGIAFWLLYPVFGSCKHGYLIKWLLLMNLVLSIGGAVAACIDVTWAMKPIGLIMFIIWNLVLAILMGIIAFDLQVRKRHTLY
jgi:hypothetical protein